MQNVCEIIDWICVQIVECWINFIDDFVSYLLVSCVDECLLIDDEVLGFCFLIFIGGLDIVIFIIGLFFCYLVCNLEQQL